MFQKTKQLFKKTSTPTTTIMDEMQLNFLLKNTVYILPCESLGTDGGSPISNKVYIDYPLFKQFVNPSNFDKVLDYFAELLIEILGAHPTIHLHVNLRTFSVTAIEKFKDIILKFYDKYSVDYVDKIQATFIYFTPSIFTAIHTAFVKLSPYSASFDVIPTLYSPKESEELVENLLRTRREICNLQTYSHTYGGDETNELTDDAYNMII
jgi:hypothetical protein